MLNSVVYATLQAHEFIKTNFFPTPTNIHYIYTLRDVYKVLQGLMLCDQKFMVVSFCFHGPIKLLNLKFNSSLSFVIP